MGSHLIIILLCFIITYIFYMLVINITFNKIKKGNEYTNGLVISQSWFRLKKYQTWPRKEVK